MKSEVDVDKEELETTDAAVQSLDLKTDAVLQTLDLMALDAAVMTVGLETIDAAAQTTFESEIVVEVPHGSSRCV